MSSGNLAAAKRLRKELQNLERATANNDPDDYDIYLRPTSPESILKWTAFLKGAPDTPYEGGIFQVSIKCNSVGNTFADYTTTEIIRANFFIIIKDYPLSPPTIAFETKIFHPNVHFRTGDVCLDILKKEWSPAWGLQAACRAVTALMSDPDADSPLNCDAGNMIRYVGSSSISLLC